MVYNRIGGYLFLAERVGLWFRDFWRIVLVACKYFFVEKKDEERAGFNEILLKDLTIGYLMF